MTDPTPDALRTALRDQLGPDGRAWLDHALERVSADATSVRVLFPAAGRHCGRGVLSAPASVPGWTVDDGVRAVLLAALPLAGADLATELAELYRYGDAAEKRGVLRSLAMLDAARDLGAAALPVVRDALRTNDTRLIAAALGPYAADRLDPPAYRQAVLKCVFVNVPLDDVAGLSRRADDELVRMLRDYARERVAAGREVPADVWRIMTGAED